MARPKKQTVDYFPHTCNHKKTMYILEQRYGNNGYAFWFKLLETLTETDGHCLDLNDETAWEFLQAKTHLSDSSCTEILNLLGKLQAIDNELWENKRMVWCQNFVDGISDVYKNRRVSTPNRPSFYRSKPRSAGVSTGENTQSKVKETKVKEIHTHLSNSFNSFWESYPKKKSKGDAEKAFAKINPNEELLAAILAKIEQGKKSEDWQKDSGKYIPHPATWLRAKGWEDEDTESKQPGRDYYPGGIEVVN